MVQNIYFFVSDVVKDVKCKIQECPTSEQSISEGILPREEDIRRTTLVGTSVS